MSNSLGRRETLALLGLSAAALMGGRRSPTPSGNIDALPDRMRGMNLEMAPGAPDATVARQLAAWRINAVRINFSTDAAARGLPDSTGPRPSRTAPLAPYRQNLAVLKAFSAACAKLRIIIILAANDLYGRRETDLSKQPGSRFKNAISAHLLEFWTAMAQELRTDSAIVAYDILNEPNYAAVGNNPPSIWQDQILPDAIHRIRAVDAAKWIVVMPWPWGFPTGYESMRPIDDPAVIYSFHGYAPHNYTHQGVGRTKPFIRYPGRLRAFDHEGVKLWDKSELAAHMRPAIDFRNRYAVRMMATEFGVARWAPGHERYIADMISIFEAEQIDWLFHTYGSWNGWNPSVAPDAPEGSAYPSLFGNYDSSAHRLLLNHWRRNARP
jgi:hypothetical protein